MSNEIDFSGNFNNVDPSQIEIDLGHVHIRDQATRDILRRQMEKGGITHADVTALQKYQNGWDYSRIGLLGGALAASVWGRFIRRPPLTMGRLFGLSTFAAFTGASIGTGMQVRAGIQAVNSLENPERFKKALTEMAQEVMAQRQAALRRPPGSQPNVRAPQDGEHTKLADGWDSSKFPQPRASPAPPASDPGSGTDRWSQLRSQKPTAQPTAWDSIRQTYERKPEGNNQSGADINESDAEKERRKAQAEFDALLEKERGFGQGNTSELKSRWS